MAVGLALLVFGLGGGGPQAGRGVGVTLGLLTGRLVADLGAGRDVTACLDRLGKL